jgi:hypothetical protein
MTLTADGHGTFDGKPIFWGSLMPYWKDVASESDCFILFGSYLSGMFFADGTATVDTEAKEQIVFAPVAAPKGTDVDVPVDVPVDAPVDVPDPAKMTVISPAFDLSLSLPTDRWTVRETEAGLLVALLEVDRDDDHVLAVLRLPLVDALDDRDVRADRDPLEGLRPGVVIIVRLVHRFPP